MLSITYWVPMNLCKLLLHFPFLLSNIYISIHVDNISMYHSLCNSCTSLENQRFDWLFYLFNCNFLLTNFCIRCAFWPKRLAMKSWIRLYLKPSLRKEDLQEGFPCVLWWHLLPRALINVPYILCSNCNSIHFVQIWASIRSAVSWTRFWDSNSLQTIFQKNISEAVQKRSRCSWELSNNKVH